MSPNLAVLIMWLQARVQQPLRGHRLELKSQLQLRWMRLLLVQELQ
jgi:hypothetical protein